MNVHLLNELAALFTAEAEPDTCYDRYARASEHEVRPTDSERAHLLAEAHRISQNIDAGEIADDAADFFSALRKVAG